MEKIKNQEKKLNKIIEIASTRGFFWPTAEIYPDRLSGFFDYGPIGILLKENIIKIWRKEIVEPENMIEIDGSQILPLSVFQASGHLKNFNDPLISCSKCNFKIRADKLIEEKTKKRISEKLSNEKYDELIKNYNLRCPKCNSVFKKTEKWNMMLKTGIGAELKEAYLRPETCQSIFTSFPRIFKISRAKLPIAIAQVGKVFRNEISPRQGLIRIREINQMEVEVFFNPEEENQIEKFENIRKEILPLYVENKIHKLDCEEAVVKKLVKSKLIAYYLILLKKFYLRLGIPEDKMRFRYVPEEERPFYSKETWDFEVSTSVGWIELCACNHRGEYDLSGHQKISKQSFEILDETTKKKVLPNVFELSIGIDRTLYTLLDLTYEEEPENDRTLFKLKPEVAPIKVAIFPLVNKEKMPELAFRIYKTLKSYFKCFYDSSGSIGRRYRRQDEIGTPFCITVDGQTLKDNTVTIRNRDDMKQRRVKINELIEWLSK